MMGLKLAPLTSSIVLVLASYWSIETIGFIAVGQFYGFPRLTMGLFLITQTVFFGILGLFLGLCRNFFYIEESGIRLEKVNIANKVTLIRVSMLPSILFLILSARNYDIATILTGALAITFITDLIDGRLSRARHEVTHMGRILDSVSDYSLLIVIAVTYRVFDLLPPWLFLIIFFRLMFQAIGMFTVLMIKKKVEPQTTFFGKVTIATIMSLFALEALKLVISTKALGFFVYIEISAGSIVGLSMLDKAYFFFNQARKETNPRDDQNEA
ncbi:MAG: CDP-alcohol phosphatidyltransferase family protein [Treponemataceae bacterium]